VSRMKRRQRHTPAENRDMAHTMAGCALHFITEPAVWPAFCTYLEASGNIHGMPQIPSSLIRAAVSVAHDVIAPDCGTPIERL
jgi:hypothetical protein